MYITGGIGSTVCGESFSVEYELPNDTVYAETCASIGLVFFARQMLKSEKNAKYSDVMEQALYNGIISGMQRDGKRFFYVNPLEVNPGISGVAKGYEHVLPERPGWYACACCPPNIVRMITSLGRYAWDEEADVIFAHLFIGGDASFEKADIHVESSYPWEGRVAYKVNAKSAEPFALAIHVPSHVKELKVRVNGEQITADTYIKDGYMYLNRKWGSADEVILEFEMPVRKIYANTKVREDAGCVAIMRGPIVYCFEGVDNGDDIQALFINRELSAKTVKCNEDIFTGMTLLDIAGKRMVCSDMDNLYSDKAPQMEDVTLRAIPYFAWGNRGLNQMRVWMHE